MPPEPPPAPDCRHGVLAFGDSITNGGGELQWGVALQSWALWVARGLGMPFTGLAVDGALVTDVTAGQIPALQRRSALPPGARYDLGCLYIGVNDVRREDWDAAHFARAHGRALGFLTDRCDRVLAVTAPAALGRPRTDAGKLDELRAAVRLGATEHGALLLDLAGFGARNQVMADRIHPTAFGQIAIAERALRLLAEHGMAVRVWPSTLIDYETTRWRRLRGDATYAYRALKAAARGHWTDLRQRTSDSPK